MDFTLYFDGACEPNPGGTGSWGYVLHGRPDSPITGMGSIPTGPTTTNNVAEWHALGFGLRRVQKGFKEDGWVYPGLLLIRGDSKLVVNQLTGEWACRAEHLIPLRDRCREILEQIGIAWRAEWVPREDNTEADALSVDAWCKATGKPFPVRVRK